MSTIEVDDEFDVPMCYVRFFKNVDPSKKSIPKEKAKEKIEIKVDYSKKRSKATKIKNLNDHIPDFEAFKRKIKIKFATNLSTEDNLLIVQGDFANQIHQILVNDYKISENDIKYESTAIVNNAEESRIIINVYQKEQKIVIENFSQDIISWFGQRGKAKNTFHAKCYVQTEGNKERVVIESINLQPLIKFLEKHQISHEDVDIFMDSKELSHNMFLPKEPKFKLNDSYPVIPKTPLYKNNVKLSTTNEKIKSYFDNNFQFIKAQFEDEKEKKKELYIDSIELQFRLLGRSEDKTKWFTRFPVKAGILDNDGSQSGSNGFLNIGDKVFINWPDNLKGEPFEGKILRIKGSVIEVLLKIDNNIKPPDYVNVDSVLNNEKSPAPIKYNVTFEPNDIIYKRRASALLYLVECMKSNPIRNEIIMHNPLNNENDNYSNNDDIFDCSFDFSNTKLEFEDRSKLKFEAKTSQSLAVEKSLKNTITLIQGPPGCGKTVTATSIVISLLKQKKSMTESKKVLICCQTNAAVENIIKVLGPPVKAFGKKITWITANVYDFFSKREFENANDEKKNLMFYQCLTRNTQEGKKYREIKEKTWSKNYTDIADSILLDKLGEVISRNIAYESDVVCCTLESSMKSCLYGLIFDTVIIDEATQAVEVASILPIVHHPNKLILIGDQKQLGPVITGVADSPEFKYKSSLFVRLLKRKFDHIMLDVQYRMHPIISQIPNMLFYNGDIINGITGEDRKCPSVKNIYLPITYYNCSGVCIKQNHSYRNQAEAELIQKIIASLLNDGKINPREIGVISFYASQVRHLNKKLEKYNPKNEIKIATVDSFQGSERDFIIISTVLTDPALIKSSFILNERRINVAITRARRGLIIVGDKDALSEASEKLWGKIFKTIDDVSSCSEEKFLSGGVRVERRNKDDAKSLVIIKSTNEDESANSNNPFKEDAENKISGFSLPEIKSSITNGKFKILWPDNEFDILSMKQYVKEMIEKMNKGTKITMAYDAESVCIQFGQIFNDNFDPQSIKSEEDVPSIGNSNGIIAFFYSKETSQKNDELMKIVKPLFEHKNITIITFDFTFDLDILQDFNISPRHEQIIDCQFIDYENEEKQNQNLISNTNVSSLKSLLKNLQYNGEYTKQVLYEINEKKEKDFPFNENKFVMKILKIPETALVTQRFLQYSANDVPLTGIIFADVLYRNKLEHVKKLTQQKLLHYDEARAKHVKPSLFREASFISNDRSTILSQPFGEDSKVNDLIVLWSKIENTLKLLSEKNKIINNLIRIDNENIRIIEERRKRIEETLKNPDEWETLCILSELIKPLNVTPAKLEINDLF